MGNKVLIVYKDLSLGGVEKMIVKIANSLNKKDLETVLALSKKRGELLKELSSSVPVNDLGGGGIVGFIRSVWGLRRIIDSEKPKSVLAYSNKSYLITYTARLISKQNPKIVLGVGNVLSIWVKYQKYSKLRNLFMKLFYLKADGLIAVSKAVKKDLVKAYFVPKEKIFVIYNFVDMSKSISRRKKEAKRPRLIYAGRFVKQKRLDLLIKAFAELRGELEAELVLLGEGPEKKRLIRLTDTLEVSDRVKFKAATREVYKEIKKANLAVLTSAVEGHPNFALEAMAVGVPVFSTRYQGAEEMISDGVDGFLLPINSTPKEISDKLNLIITKEKKLMKVVTKAKAKLEKFEKEKWLKKYKDVLLGTTVR